jgi:predicted MFS family arabinose efflux permease
MRFTALFMLKTGAFMAMIYTFLCILLIVPPGWNGRLTRVERSNDYDEKRKTSLYSGPFMLDFYL